MQRLAPLLLVVLALAVPTAAFADGTTSPAPAPAAPAQQGHPLARMRLELLRLRVRLVDLRYRVVCHDPASSACTAFTQKAVDRLTTIDRNVQAKLAQLDCSAAGADEKCTRLAKIDQRLQQVIAKLGNPNG